MARATLSGGPRRVAAEHDSDEDGGVGDVSTASSEDGWGMVQSKNGGDSQEQVRWLRCCVLRTVDFDCTLLYGILLLWPGSRFCARLRHH